jgi:hypothetical protein
MVISPVQCSACVIRCVFDLVTEIFDLVTDIVVGIAARAENREGRDTDQR